jgi:hypothetical protein
LGLAVALGGAGCAVDERSADDVTHDDAGDDRDGPTVVTFPIDQATSEVMTTLTDYAFVGLPSAVEGPNVLFRATVRGGKAHELVVVDAEGRMRAAIGPFRAADGERVLAAVLDPGRYTVQCLVKEGTRTHAQLGMRRDLTVEAG